LTASLRIHSASSGDIDMNFSWLRLAIRLLFELEEEEGEEEIERSLYNPRRCLQRPRLRYANQEIEV
jgi:hypothetical protein